jgi:phosphoglycerate dehydrogenase-like enzyme
MRLGEADAGLLLELSSRSSHWAGVAQLDPAAAKYLLIAVVVHARKSELLAHEHVLSIVLTVVQHTVSTWHDVPPRCDETSAASGTTAPERESDMS